MPSQTSDAIVIGGGIIGMSIAWRLAQRQISVTVLEAAAVGGEASWAGAGMLAPGGEIEERTPWSDFAVESLHLYPAFVEELESESGSKIDFRQSGGLDLAFDEAEWRGLESRAVRQSAIGIPSEIAPPMHGAYAARFYPGEGLVDPRDVMRSLRQACLARGAIIREHEAATSIDSRESVSVESDRNHYSAAAAVLAAGAWSSLISIRIKGQLEATPRSFPIRGHLLGYRLEPGSIIPILRHSHTYILQRAGGLTIAGSSSEEVGFNREIDAGIVADIHGRATRILPALRNPIPWLGFRPATSGLAPEIRRLPGSHLWLAYGHYRNGILLAPATARHIAAEMAAAIR